jgi:GNAT superfamily N-acetyltransferase
MKKEGSMPRPMAAEEASAPLSWARRREAVDCLTDAFTEDPCLHFLLDSPRYDPAKARHIHAYTLRVGALYGRTLAVGEPVEGASIWLPPARVEVSTWMFLRAGGLGMLGTGDGGIIDRVKRYGDFSTELHHRNAIGEHWYLLSVGVRRASQGRGLGRALIQPMLELFDRQKQGCYLETHNAKNLPLYENYGFVLREKGCIPGSETTQYAMYREPRPRRA